MQQQTFITLEKSARVTTLWLTRPDARNALNKEMIIALNQILTRLEQDKTCDFVLLRAQGNHFSAGADIQWMRQQSSMTFEQNLDDARPLAELMHRLDNLPQTTVAIVQGAAYGGALGLIACCDVAIAHENANFCFSEVKLGLIPAIISPYVQRSIGSKFARSLMLTAQLFDANKAQTIGLIDSVCADIDVALANSLEQFKANSSPAMRQTKNLLHRITGQSINPKVISATLEAIANIRVTDDAQQRMHQFLSRKST